MGSSKASSSDGIISIGFDYRIGLQQLEADLTDFDKNYVFNRKISIDFDFKSFDETFAKLAEYQKVFEGSVTVFQSLGANMEQVINEQAPGLDHVLEQNKKSVEALTESFDKQIKKLTKASTELNNLKTSAIKAGTSMESDAIKNKASEVDSLRASCASLRAELSNYVGASGGAINESILLDMDAQITNATNGSEKSANALNSAMTKIGVAVDKAANSLSVYRLNCQKLVDTMGQSGNMAEIGAIKELNSLLDKSATLLSAISTDQANGIVKKSDLDLLNEYYAIINKLMSDLKNGIYSHTNSSGTLTPFENLDDTSAINSYLAKMGNVKSTTTEISDGMQKLTAVIENQVGGLDKVTMAYDTVNGKYRVSKEIITSAAEAHAQAEVAQKAQAEAANEAALAEQEIAAKAAELEARTASATTRTAELNQRRKELEDRVKQNIPEQEIANEAAKAQVKQESLALAQDKVNQKRKEFEDRVQSGNAEQRLQNETERLRLEKERLALADERLTKSRSDYEAKVNSGISEKKQAAELEKVNNQLAQEELNKKKIVSQTEILDAKTKTALDTQIAKQTEANAKAAEATTKLQAATQAQQLATEQTQTALEAEKLARDQIATQLEEETQKRQQISEQSQVSAEQTKTAVEAEKLAREKIATQLDEEAQKKKQIAEQETILAAQNKAALKEAEASESASAALLEKTRILQQQVIDKDKELKEQRAKKVQDTVDKTYASALESADKLLVAQTKLNNMKAQNLSATGLETSTSDKFVKQVQEVDRLNADVENYRLKLQKLGESGALSGEQVQAAFERMNAAQLGSKESVEAYNQAYAASRKTMANFGPTIQDVVNRFKLLKERAKDNGLDEYTADVTEAVSSTSEISKAVRSLNGTLSAGKKALKNGESADSYIFSDASVAKTQQNMAIVEEFIAKFESGIFSKTNSQGTLVENVGKDYKEVTKYLESISTETYTWDKNATELVKDANTMVAVFKDASGVVDQIVLSWDQLNGQWRQSTTPIVTQDQVDAQQAKEVAEAEKQKAEAAKKYATEIKNAEQEINKQIKQYEALNKKIEEIEDNNIANGLAADSGDEYAKYSKQREDLGKSIQENIDQYKVLNTSVTDVQAIELKWANAQKESTAAQKEAARAAKDQAQADKEAAQQVKEKTAEINSQIAAYKSLTNAIKDTVKSNLDQGLDYNAGDYDKLVAERDALGATISQNIESLNNMTGGTENVTKVTAAFTEATKSLDVATLAHTASEKKRKQELSATEKELKSQISSYVTLSQQLATISNQNLANGLPADSGTEYANISAQLKTVEGNVDSLRIKYENLGATTEQLSALDNQWTIAQEKARQAGEKSAQQIEKSRKEADAYRETMDLVNKALNGDSVSGTLGFINTDSYNQADIYTKKVNQLKDIFVELDTAMPDKGVTVLSADQQAIIQKSSPIIKSLLQELNSQKYLQTNKSGILTELTDKDYQSVFDYINKNIGEINVGTQKWNEETGKMTVSVKNVDGQMQNVVMTFDDANGVYRKLVTTVGASEGTFTKIGNALKNSLSYFANRFTGYQMWTWITRGVTSGIEAITELDTALTEMRKVSDESEASLRDLQQSFFDIADTIGTTASDLSDATASFMRIGESAEEATESATQAAILYNVSEFESIDDAADALVAVSQAYQDIEKSQIVDIINELGNNYAIATDDLSEALQTVSSTMSLLGVSLEQTSALITTANETIQDESKVATGLRTIALRIFSTDEGNEELEAMGEDVDEFVTTTVSAKDEIIKAYTAVASNQHKGISIIDEETGTYRNLYDILLDIAEIYEEIQEEDLLYGTNRATALIEELAGKNRSNILSSLLSSPDTLVAALESAENAEGSAEEELSKYLDSIEGKLEILSNSAQEFWSNLISSDFIKFVLDVADDLLGWVIALQDANMLLPSIITLIAGIGEAKSGLVSGIASDFLDSKALKTVKNLFSGLASDATNVGDVLANTTSEINNLGTIVIESGDAIGDSFDGIIVAGDDALDSVDSIIVDVDDLRYSTVDLGDAVDDTYDPFIDTLSDTENTMDGVAAASENAASGITKMGNASQTAQIATKSLKAVIAALVTMAVVKTIQWTAAAITAFADAEDDARESVSSANDVINDTADSIDDYKEQIEACLEIINDESSSITESQEAREELLSIQDELIENYGTETQAITAITSAIEGEVDALDKLTQNEYESQKAALINSDQGGFFKNIGHSLSNVVNGYDDDFDRAISTYENGLQDLSKYTISTSSDLYDLVSSIDGVTTSLNTDVSAFVSIDDGPLEEQLQAAYDLQEALSSYDGSVPTGITNGLAETIEDLEEAVEAYSSMYELYMEYDSGSPLKSSAYADMYEDLQDAYKAYNEAVIDGDEEAVESAIKAYSEIYDNLTETAINNNDDNVAYYVSTLYEALNQATDEWKFQVDVEANVEFGEDGSDIEDTLDDVFGGFKYSSDAIEYVLDQTNAQGDAKEIRDTLIAIMDEYNLSEEQLIDVLQEFGHVISDEEDILRDTFGQENMDTLTSADLTAALQLTQEEVNACNGDFEKLKDAIKEYREEEYATSIASNTLTDSVSSISDSLQSQFDALEESYETIFSDDGFSLGNVDQEFMDDVVSQFTDLDEDFEDAFDTDALDNWVAVLSDSSSTAEDVQNAYDVLANAWLEASGVLDNLDDNTKDYITTALESMGVSNAEEVVESNLIQTKADLKWSDEELATATYDDIKAFAEEEAAVGYVDQAIALLLLRQMALNNEDVNYVSDGDQILAYADSIGMASDTLDEYREALENYQSAQSNGKTSLANQYLEQVEELGEELLEEASTWTAPIASYISDGIEQGAATITRTVSKLTNDIEPVFESLADAYTSIWDEDTGFSLDIDNSVLEGVRSAFDDLDDDISEAFDTDVLDDFLSVLADTTSSSEDVQDAFNALATEYINAAGLLDVLNEDTVDYVATQLENIGVTNAEEVALSLLAQKEAEAIDETYDLSNATDDEIIEFMELQGVSQETIAQLALLKLAQIEISDNPINEAESISQVLALGKAAGVATEMVLELQQVQDDIASGSLSDAGLTAATNKYKQLLAEYEEELNNFTVDIDFDGWSSTFADSSSSSSSSSDASDTADEYVDAYEEAKEKLQTLRDRDEISEREYLRRLRVLYSQYYADVEDYSDEFFEEQREYLEEYKEYYDGVIEYIIDIYEDQIDDLEDECDDVVEALEDQQEAAHDAYQAQIDEIEDLIDALDDQIDAYDKQIKQLEKQQKVYEKQIDALEDQIDAYDDEIEELEDQIDAYDDQIEAIEKIQEEYEDEIELLEEKQEALEDVIEEYEDQIEVYEDMIDAYQEQIDAIQDEIDALEDANDERERELALQEALYNLEQAKNQKTNLVYSAESGYTYQADDEAIKEAEDALYEAQLDITVAALEKEIDALEELQDSIQDEIDLIEDQIEAIEDQIDELQDQIEVYEDMIDALDDEIEAIEDLQEAIEDQIEEIEELQEALQDQIDLIQDQIDAIEDQIEVIEEYQDAIQEQIDLYEEQVDDLNDMMDDTDDYFDDLIDTTKKFYEEQEKAIQVWIDEFTELLGLYDDAVNRQNLLSAGFTEEDILGMTIEDFAAIETEYIGILTDMSNGNAELQQQISELGNVNIAELNGHLTETNQQFSEMSGVDLSNAINASQSLRDGFLDAKSAVDLLVSAVGGDATGLVDMSGTVSNASVTSIVSALQNAESTSDVVSAEIIADIQSIIEQSEEYTSAQEMSTEELYALVTGYLASGTEDISGAFAQISEEAITTQSGIITEAVEPLVATVESSNDELSEYITGTNDAISTDATTTSEEIEKETTDSAKTIEERLEELASTGETVTDELQSGFEDTTSSIDDATSRTESLIEKLKAVPSKVSTVFETIYTTVTSAVSGSSNFAGTVGNAYASGYSGLKRDEKNALRSEYGQAELTVYPDGTYELTDEPVISDLPKDTVIFNEDQTKRIMRGGSASIGQISRSFAGGTITELDPSNVLITAMTASILTAGTKIIAESGISDLTNAINNIETKSSKAQAITQTFNITMPNVTDGTSAEKLMRDLQLIASKKVQYFG